MFRKWIAKWLVRYVGKWISASYEAYFDGMPRLSRFFSKGANRIQRFAFPLARKLDKEAMVTQMIDEGWWG